jgi:hypothetical protein
MTRNAKLAALLIAVVLVPAAAAFAQYPTPIPPPSTQPPIESGQGIIDFLNQVLTWLAYIFWIFAAIFIFWAGFLYLTAAGNDEKIKKANHQLRYAVIAIIVGLFAFGLPRLVLNILQRR